MLKHKHRATGLVGLTAIAASAGALFLSASAAHAAAAVPPWEVGNAAAVGTISFYDANGNVITSGRSDVAPFSAYAVGSNAIEPGDVQAGLIYAAPDPNKSPATFPKKGVGLFTNYPVTSGPASITGLPATTPVVTEGTDDSTLDGFYNSLSAPVTDPTSPYYHAIQIRIRTADVNGQQSQTYLTADLKVDTATHTWTQIYPAPTTLTVAASPSTAGQGDPVTLTATETPAVAGSVQFEDGSTAIGAPVPVNGSGVATTSTSTLTRGTHTINAVFSPTSAGNGPSSATTSVVITAPATKTVLAVSPNQTVGTSATATATVTGPGSTPNSAGSVDFYDNGSTTPIGTVPAASAANGVYTLTLPTGFAGGMHSVVAKFTPSDPTQFAGSTSNTVKFSIPVGACADPSSTCTDQQNIQVTVPSGTLVINTPYDTSSPLDLGTMTPTSSGTQLTASKAFQNIVITDMRNGANGYTVSAQSSDLTDGKSNAGSTINSQNVGLTGVTGAGGTGFAGTVTGVSNPAADPAVAAGAAGNQGLGGSAAHSVLTVTGASRGTVTANGLLTINAPTSTEPGLFTGTITFTVG